MCHVNVPAALVCKPLSLTLCHCHPSHCHPIHSPLPHYCHSPTRGTVQDAIRYIAENGLVLNKFRSEHVIPNFTGPVGPLLQAWEVNEGQEQVVKLCLICGVSRQLIKADIWNDLTVCSDRVQIRLVEGEPSQLVKHSLDAEILHLRRQEPSLAVVLVAAIVVAECIAGRPGMRLAGKGSIAVEAVNKHWDERGCESNHAGLGWRNVNEHS